jgi:predicted dehydrogenase
MMSQYGVGFRIQRAEVHAEDFSAYMDLTRGRQCLVYEATSDAGGLTEGALKETPLDLEAVGDAGFDETRHLVDCILDDREPWTTLDDAVHTMRLCEAIRSGHKGPL